MSEKPNSVWKIERHESAQARILDAAWEFVREEGLAALSLRDLAGRVGLAPASLYSYFASKHGIYDAMFAQGYRQFLERQGEPSADLGDELRRVAHSYMSFCMEEPVRYQLLFQRTIPGFEPSPESWALAQQCYQELARLRVHGLTTQDIDLVSAVLTGLVDQQISNDPHGTRWVALLDDAASMLHTHFSTRPRTSKKKGRPQ